MALFVFANCECIDNYQYLYFTKKLVAKKNKTSKNTMNMITGRRTDGQGTTLYCPDTRVIWPLLSAAAIGLHTCCCAEGLQQRRLRRAMSIWIRHWQKW